MATPRRESLVDIVPAEYVDPDGIIAFYETLGVGDARRQQITKRAKNSVRSYLRHVIDHKPRVVVRRPTNSRSVARLRATRERLEQALADPSLDIVNRFEMLGQLAALNSPSAAADGTAHFRQDELDAMRQDFYLFAKFYCLHENIPPRVFLEVGVPFEDLTAASLSTSPQ